MGLPQKGELTLASTINEMQTLLENQRDSIQASGKGYSSDIEYEQFDSCIFNSVEYISIYNGTHQGRTPDISPAYWENRLEFDGINDLTNLYVAKDSKQSLSDTNALGINNYILSLNKGDGSTETITLPQTDLSTYTQQDSNRVLHSTDALRIGDNVIYLYKGDGSFESVNISEGIGNYVSKSSIQALHATDALRLSGDTLSLYKGDGSSESIDLGVALDFDAGHSFGSTGYQKFSNGLIIQWGIINYEVKTISFPIAFPTVCRNVNISIKDTTYGNAVSPQYFSTDGWSKSSFELTRTDSLGGTRNYIAIGY